MAGTTSAWTSLVVVCELRPVPAPVSATASLCLEGLKWETPVPMARTSVCTGVCGVDSGNHAVVFVAWVFFSSKLSAEVRDACTNASAGAARGGDACGSALPYPDTESPGAKQSLSSAPSLLRSSSSKIPLPPAN